MVCYIESIVSNAHGKLVCMYVFHVDLILNKDARIRQLPFQSRHGTHMYQLILKLLIQPSMWQQPQWSKSCPICVGLLLVMPIAGYGVVPPTYLLRCRIFVIISYMRSVACCCLQT